MDMPNPKIVIMMTFLNSYNVDKDISL